MIGDITGLDRLIRPRSIAIVGASPEPRSIASVVLNNLDTLAYSGEVHLVSRSRTEINGRPCVPEIAALPNGVDVAVLCIPQHVMVASMEACAERGIAGVVVFASGYAETGEAGRVEQTALASLSQKLGLLVIGPNCMGMANLLDRTPLSFTEFYPNPEPVTEAIAVIAQSGAMMGSIASALQAKDCAVAYAFSTGNEAVLGVEDFLAYVLENPVTRVVAIFAEQLRKPQRFLELVDRARSAGKHIVLLHPGQSVRARASAASHTGSIAGDHAVMEVMVREHGVVVVPTFEELFDVSAILLRYPEPPASSGIAITSNSGAFGGFAIDFCDALGLPIAPTSATTLKRLRTFLPPYVGVEHFVDLGTAGRATPAVYGDSARALLDDENVGSLVIAMVGGSPGSQLAKAHSVLPRVAGEHKRVALVILGDETPLDSRFLELVRASRLPFFRSAERAFRALATLSKHERLAARPDSGNAVEIPPLPPLAAGTLGEYQAKELLRAIGVSVPPGALVSSLDEARRLAREIGFPIVLKAQATGLVHKSDIGAVVTGIRNDDELAAGWKRIEVSLRNGSTSRLEGMLVEAMIPHHVELLVGARRDLDWGPVLVVGLGGVWVEVLHDVRVMPAGAGPDRILDELEQLRSAALLHGARRGVPLQLDGFADVVTRIGALMLAHPEILELDVNPIVPATTGFVALDALVVVTEAT